MRPALPFVMLWPIFFVAFLCRPAAAQDPPTHHSFAVAFTSPENFDRVSNDGSLTLSWRCTPLARGSSPSHARDAQLSPKLVLSIHNENIQTQVLYPCVSR
jgi:hypothetical protein